MASQSPRKYGIPKRTKKRSPKHNDKQTSQNETSNANDHNSKRCPVEKCECWIRLKTYCEHFKVDQTEVPNAMEIDEIAEKATSSYPHLRSKTLDYDMTELWQHYLLYHLEEHNNDQCKLRKICPFVKGIKDQYYYYRKRSWNLAQTMHVYFYHTQEYMQARDCSARKHRYIRDRTSYRLRQTQLLMDKPTHTGAINISQSSTATPIQNNQIMAQEEVMAHLELGPGFTDRSDDDDDDDDEYNTNHDNHPNPIDVTLEPEEDDDDDDDLDINQVTQLQSNDYYAIQYQSTTSNVSFPTLEFGTPFIAQEHEAKYKNPKDEILNNQFACIQKREWNVLLQACFGYHGKQHAKRIGLKLTEVVGLKLYTDFDELQRAYRKCYREKQPDRRSRQKQFYHWNMLLLSACSKSADIIVDTLYHGVNEAFSTPSYSGTYYGPISTTATFSIAKQFAGAQGRIFELYPTFARRGLKVSWLSNFPDEGEVLYMNTSFQIVNVYHAAVTLQQITNSELLNESHILFEKAILKALHVLNTESNVISFSDMQDLPPKQDFAFHRLDEHEQISILYLLYLQYSQYWDKFWQKQQNHYKRIAFAKYRDQFIVLAKNVVAVKMERIPMLIQHFFYESHKKYKFPFKDADIQDGLYRIKEQFMKNQPLRFETITRLFPNTQQLLINGNNFDWTLDRLIKFMMKYNTDDVKLQDIEIRFIPQYPDLDAKYEADEEEAAKRLQHHKTHKNITKLKKLGWIFASPCHLRRVGFEPLPELPFLTVFMHCDTDQEIYYRTYSRNILNRSLLDTRATGHVPHAESMTEDMSYTMDGHTRLSYSAAINSPYSPGNSFKSKQQQQRSHKALLKRADTNPGVMTPLHEEKAYEEGQELDDSKQPYAFTNKTAAGRSMTNSNSTYKSSQRTLSGLHSEEKSLSLAPTSSFSNAILDDYEGRNPLVLNYNPQNCVLCHDVMDKLEYKDELIKALFWRVKNPKIKNPTDKTRKKFIKFARKVEVLVIDPMPFELAIVFMEKVNTKKPIISFANVYKLFPNVTDIFLRHTPLNLRMVFKIQTFVEQNPHTQLERIFFQKHTPIGQLQIPELLRRLKPINFAFVENEQMVVRNPT